jgi:hypothetical protein
MVNCGVGARRVDGWPGISYLFLMPGRRSPGTGLKRVYCLTFDRDGNLWVGMDDSVVCRRDDG